jgi:hypothetical protein
LLKQKLTVTFLQKRVYLSDISAVISKVQTGTKLMPEGKIDILAWWIDWFFLLLTDRLMSG